MSYTHNYTTTEANAVYRELIHNYGYKPEPIISRRRGESEKALTLGVEVEAEFSPATYDVRGVASAARCVADICDGRVYMKRDGSVDRGFEIVSHPATLASHMYDAHWTGILNKVSKHGMRSHDAKEWGGSCGLHVHVGRAQLGRTQEERDDVIRKITVIVSRHWDAFVKFSRRNRNQLDQWARRPYRVNDAWGDFNSDNAADCFRVTNDHFDRYWAINCENAATVEFRLFNGTLKRDTLIATLQLVHNVCLYAMAKTWEEIQQEDDFLAIATYRRYNELDTYLAARGLAAAPETRAQNTGRNPRHNGRDGI